MCVLHTRPKPESRVTISIVFTVSILFSTQVGTIVSVALIGCQLTHVQLSPLLPHIFQCVALSELDLSNNQLDDSSEGWRAIIAAFQV